MPVGRGLQLKITTPAESVGGERVCMGDVPSGARKQSAVRGPVVKSGSDSSGGSSHKTSSQLL